MKEFTIFYNHTEYGYYSTKISSDGIIEALEEFTGTHEHDGVYGIMQVH